LLGQGTLEYRVHFSYDGQTISPWHDIPLTAGAGLDGPLHFCCEIPKWTRRKFEVATKEADNPVKQDEKKGVLREYKWGGACRVALRSCALVVAHDHPLPLHRHDVQLRVFPSDLGGP
jgi:hypothetical protein